MALSVVRTASYLRFLLAPPDAKHYGNWKIENFLCVSFRGSGIELFRYFIINEKKEYFVLQGKKNSFQVY